MAIGCYPLQAALIAFDHEEPELIRATGHTREFRGEITDTMACITLLFKNNRMAVLNNLGQDIDSIGSLKIHGTKGNKLHLIHKYKTIFFNCKVSLVFPIIFGVQLELYCQMVIMLIIIYPKQLEKQISRIQSVFVMKQLHVVIK
jgi:hypothetical protein